MSYCHVQAHVHPDQFEELPNGVCIQEIELLFGDDPEKPSWRQAQSVACAIDARRARELAFELLTLAEVAECWEQAR